MTYLSSTPNPINPSENTMTAPIDQPSILQPYVDKINELEALNARLRTELQEVTQVQTELSNRWSRAVAKVANFFTSVYQENDETVDQALADAKAPDPVRKYRFKYRVTGYVWQETTGRSLDDAWDNLDPEFDRFEVEDLEYDDSGSYEDVEELGTDNLATYDAATWLRG